MDTLRELEKKYLQEKVTRRGFPIVMVPEVLGRAVLLSDEKSSNNARFLLPLVAKRGRPLGRQNNSLKK
jgi:hypothetical protein